MKRVFGAMMLASGLMLSACAQPGLHASEAPGPLTAAPAVDAKSCEARGGTWKRLGLVGHWQCEYRLSDGGRPCESNADCQGTCLAPPGAQAGQRVVGQCAAVKPLYGCYARVSGGVAEPALCVD